MTDLRDELRDAERAVYARPGIGETEADRSAAVERLQAVRERIDRDREVADAAVERLRAVREERDRERLEVEAEGGARTLEGIAPERDPLDVERESESPLSRERRHRRTGTILVASTLVVAAAIAMGVYVADNVETGSLAVFNRPQTAEEAAQIELFSGQDADEMQVRFLGSEESWDVFAYRRVEVEAWQTRAEEICLAFVEHNGATMSCMPVDQFETTGFQTTMPGYYDGEAGVWTDFEFHWGPTGPLKSEIVSYEFDTKP